MHTPPPLLMILNVVWQLLVNYFYTKATGMLSIALFYSLTMLFPYVILYSGLFKK